MEVAELGTERGGAGHGGVDMEPETFSAADPARFAGSDRSRSTTWCRPWRTRSRANPRPRSCGDSLGKPVRTHRERVVDFDQPEVVLAQAGDAHRFLDRGMRLGRSCRPPVGRRTPRWLWRARGTLAGRQQRAERRRSRRSPGSRRRRAPLDLNRAGRSEQVDHPIEHVRLEFGAGGAGGPEHPLDTEPGREQFAQDRGARSCWRERSRRNWATASG